VRIPSFPFKPYHSFASITVEHSFDLIEAKAFKTALLRLICYKQSLTSKPWSPLTNPLSEMAVFSSANEPTYKTAMAVCTTRSIST
ncbi:hypothetical protein CEXT_754991, partial [Caerostris extrusa]